MKIDIEKVKAVHNVPASRFEVQAGPYLAVLEYALKGKTIIFYHTGVPDPIEGQGIGNLLAYAGLEYAKQKQYNVVPACVFMAVYIKRHKEYRPLVKK
ncbi:MAG TPA: GNAT family N-acetyltransferase [Anaerolineales bacterium]|nr:GNAT family N-acetyltransferase [Anaerolineales bacterium]